MIFSKIMKHVCFNRIQLLSCVIVLPYLVVFTCHFLILHACTVVFPFWALYLLCQITATFAIRQFRSISLHVSPFNLMCICLCRHCLFKPTLAQMQRRSVFLLDELRVSFDFVRYHSFLIYIIILI